jgi:hypothetical protein
MALALATLLGLVWHETAGAAQTTITVKDAASAIHTFNVTTDGTNFTWNNQVCDQLVPGTCATVKAASTQPAATDPALVVSIGPNSVPQTPTVTQAVGSTPWITDIKDGAGNGPVAVKPASTAPIATDPALVVTISPNSPASSAPVTVNQGTNPWTDVIKDGSGNGPVVVKPGGTSPVGTDAALVVSISPNSAGLLPTGQAVMANSSPVVIASNQSSVPVTVSNVNANGQATMTNSSPVVIASNQSALAVTQAPTGQQTMTNSQSVAIASNQSPLPVNTVSINNVSGLPHMCGSFAKLQVSSNADTQIVALASGKSIYVCDYKFMFSAAGAFYLETATGAACAGPVQMDVLWTGLSTAPIGKGAGNPWYQGLPTVTSGALCVHTTAMSGTLDVGVYYDQY